MTDKRSPSQAQDRLVPATAFTYVDCDVPPGMRLDEWRRARNRARRTAKTDARHDRRKARAAGLRGRISQR
jgi:hypothetical protein